MHAVLNDQEKTSILYLHTILSTYYYKVYFISSVNVCDNDFNNAFHTREIVLKFNYCTTSLIMKLKVNVNRRMILIWQCIFDVVSSYA